MKIKWIFRILTLLSLGVALTLPLWITHFRDGALGGGTAIPVLSPLSKSIPEPEREVTVYKWRDASGQWHYSDSPPEDGSEVATLTVSNKANIIQPLADTKAAPEEPVETEKKPAAKEEPKDDGLTLENLRNIMEDTRNARDLMEKRNQALEDITGGGE